MKTLYVAFFVAVLVGLAMMIAKPIGSASDRWIVPVSLGMFVLTAWIFHGRAHD